MPPAQQLLVARVAELFEGKCANRRKHRIAGRTGEVVFQPGEQGLIVERFDEIDRIPDRWCANRRNTIQGK